MVTFGKDLQQSPDQTTLLHHVYVSQVISEPVLVNKSIQLEQALEYGNFTGEILSTICNNYKTIPNFQKALNQYRFIIFNKQNIYRLL